ncbi:hypothetical protein P3W55_13355 [Pseudomonas citronellolis]|uniref:DUF2802 domain-containing protein n=1 Tax=Pseudomonas citronellolis TaxID=53408 RepID=A0AAW6P864_9PSED|nr:hypothetical protein [Pseudomonas citronellolis]MDF3842697.1 hypothetical protein [Pseudomonas citronellolis]
MLTNHQITALVLGILLPMALLISAAYARGTRQGRLLAAATEYVNGYEAAQAEQSEHITALQDDIGTLNQRVTVLAAALDHEQAEHQAAKRALAAAGEDYSQILDLNDHLGEELGHCRTLLLTDEEQHSIARAASILQREAKRLAKTGTNKTNHAADAQADLAEILRRRVQSTRAAA